VTRGNCNKADVSDKPGANASLGGTFAAASKETVTAIMELKKAAAKG
jgi:hypothetical protein